MRKLTLPLLVALAFSTAVAQEKDQPKDSKALASEKTEESKGETRAGNDQRKEKRGKVTIGGAEVNYVAQVGTMPLIKDDGGVRAEVFYVYYAASDAGGRRLATADASARPIMFCFNGGPGSSAVWLHFGGLGPRKVELPPDGLQSAMIGRIADNPLSVLDKTDLVFIDPVGTGASRPAKGEKPEQFWGVEEDVESVGEFIRLFTSREGRWPSPKYLCGESYGVLRASALANWLQDRHGMYIHGLVLISGLLSFQTLSPDIGSDLPYILFLPTLTATAHYHKKLPAELQADRERAIAESRKFALNEYSLALLKGRTIPEEEKRAVAARLAQFTGLDAKLIEDQQLRIRPELFREHLLRAENKILGRFDSRVTGHDATRRDSPEFDPSFSNVIGPFSATANAFIRGELGYEVDHPYRILTGLPWNYRTFAGRYVNVSNNLADAMKENPNLRLLICVGDCDLAVPPDTIRYSIDHLPIPDPLRANIRWERYESGHMMYLLQKDAEKLRRDIVSFLDAAAGRR